MPPFGQAVALQGLQDQGEHLRKDGTPQALSDHRQTRVIRGGFVEREAIATDFAEQMVKLVRGTRSLVESLNQGSKEWRLEVEAEMPLLQQRHRRPSTFPTDLQQMRIRFGEHLDIPQI